MSLREWPAVIRAAGLQAREVNGFPNTPTPQGGMPDNIAAIFWHHDASPPGPSPGALDWIISSYNSAQPSAQIWVDYNGTWHFAGIGYASHAGVVRGNLTSRNSVGVETDHTINEPMTVGLLSSLRKGFAAIAKHEGRGADMITFHKIEAFPRGRKTDPYFEGTDPYDESIWDAELARERRIIQGIIDGGITPPASDDWWDTVDAAQAEALMRKVVTSELDARGIKKDLTSEVNGLKATHGQYQVWNDGKLWKLQQDMWKLLKNFNIARTEYPPKPVTPPVVTTEKYTVKAGDSWDAIASRYGTNRAGLQKLNPGVKDINNIIAGETVLTVPKR